MFARQSKYQMAVEPVAELAETVTWEKRPFPAYWSADVTENFRTPHNDLVRAFLVCLPPNGGEIHRHQDANDVHSKHVVVSTNPQALNFWVDESGEHSQHMEQGKTYIVDRSLEHWARNDGDTPRVHLIIETRK